MEFDPVGWARHGPGSEATPRAERRKSGAVANAERSGGSGRPLREKSPRKGNRATVRSPWPVEAQDGPTREPAELAV